MRMRLHFGNLLLNEWKGNKLVYIPVELRDLLLHVGPRGTAGFDTLISTDDVPDFSALRARLDVVDGIIPLATGPKTFDGVKPVYSIILVTKNLSVESVIEVSRGPGETIETAERYFGAVQVFHREKRNLKMEIIKSCPESRYDWMLELQNFTGQDEARAVVPFTPRLLQQNVAFTGKTAFRGFPAFRIADPFVSKHKIDEVFGKVAWTYTLSAHYRVDVGEYRRWDTEAKVLPSAGFSVALYATDWEEKLEAAHISDVRRLWAPFPQEFLGVDSSFSSRVSEWARKENPGHFDDFFLLG